MIRSLARYQQTPRLVPEEALSFRLSICETRLAPYLPCEKASVLEPKCSCTQTSSFEEDASSAGVGTAAKDEVVTTTESFQQEETRTKQETTRLFPTEV